MDFSSWQTWILIAIGAVVILALIGAVSGKKDTPKTALWPDSTPGNRVATRAATFAALSSHATNFDRNMYIDDMTSEQLEDEHVWRTAYIACHYITMPCGVSDKHPANRIAIAITGKPFDRQLFGLTEYYLETAYEDMMARGEDRYWDEDLIAGKDQWPAEKREQIILAALIPLARAHDIYVAVRKAQPGPDDTGAELIPLIDRTAQAFFGAEADTKMAALRAKAAQLASAVEI